MTRKIRNTLADSPDTPGVGSWPRGEDWALFVPAARRKIVRGRSDMTGCEQIRELSLKCARAIGSGASLLVLDLTSVERADTKLMACLVSVFQLARSSAVSVHLRNSQTVSELAEFCRLTWLIEQTRMAEPG